MTQGTLFQDLDVRRPALRYFGGKWRNAPAIIATFPEHRCYGELFGGGASVLLRKPRAAVEVYNDAAGAVVNFFRVARDQGEELRRLLELTPFALDEYSSCREQAGNDLERARRFFVRSWGGHHGTNGSVRARGWRRSAERDHAGEFAKAAQGLEQVTARLRGVAIENLDWRDVLRRYDGPDTFFYADPPYVMATRASVFPSDGYGEHEFSDADHRELCAALSSTRGAVVLSGYDSDLYREALRGAWERIVVGHGEPQEIVWRREAARG